MTTLTLQPDDTSGVDTFIRSDSATVNFGTNTALAVGEETGTARIDRTLIKFDLSSIPTNAIITNVVLSLWTLTDVSTNARNYKLYRLLRDWVEAQATWNVWKTANNWTTAGAGSDGNDADLSTVWATCSFTATESAATKKDFVLDATGLAEFTKWVNGTNPNYGWLIKADTETDDAYTFDSSSSATSSQRPKLIVDYTLPSGKFFQFFSQ